MHIFTSFANICMHVSICIRTFVKDYIKFLVNKASNITGQEIEGKNG